MRHPAAYRCAAQGLCGRSGESHRRWTSSARVTRSTTSHSICLGGCRWGRWGRWGPDAHVPRATARLDRRVDSPRETFKRERGSGISSFFLPVNFATTLFIQWIARDEPRDRLWQPYQHVGRVVGPDATLSSPNGHATLRYLWRHPAPCHSCLDDGRSGEQNLSLKRPRPRSHILRLARRLSGPKQPGTAGGHGDRSILDIVRLPVRADKQHQLHHRGLQGHRGLQQIFGPHCEDKHQGM